MGLTLRSIVNRPLSSTELDGNFEYLASYAVPRSELPSATVANSTYALTASCVLGNIESANFANVASFATMADSASYVNMAANILGGTQGYISLWSSDTTLTKSSIYEGDIISIGKPLDLYSDLRIKGKVLVKDKLVLSNGLSFNKEEGTDVIKVTSKAEQLYINSGKQQGTKVFIGTVDQNQDTDITEAEIALGASARTSGTINALKLTGTLLQSAGDTTINYLNINPTYQQKGIEFKGKVVGVYYNPTIITYPQGTHVAFENTKGDNYFNSEEGSTLIGTTEKEDYKFKVSGTVKFDTLLNLAPVETLPERPKTGDVVMSGSMEEAVLCYYNGSTWKVL